MRGYGRALVVRLPKRIVRTVADRSPVDPVIHVPIDTKLHGPGSRQEWVNRPRLLRELTGTTSTKLVLVDAPAGFGKTTLLAQWRSAATQDRPVAWLSLDRGDDDPGRLWWHVVSALAQACPELGGEDILGALAAQTADIQGTVIPMLVNKLMGSPVKITLVLDDYHVIKDLRCHEQVAALLRHLPPTLLMVLATRVSPPLPLARLRALGEMTEIRMRELRFTRQEATALVRTVSAVDLTVPELTDLVRRTEGWPTGLYLAAMALRGHPSPRDFVHQFTGDNRFVADFLAEEVLSRQPAEIRQFLTRTSILGRFCAPLCDAVAGTGQAATIIDTLERENLFVIPLDETRRWFRYHKLFAQVLRSRLARTEPDMVITLHERASAWNQAEGLAGEAIDHALAARDVPRAVDLIANNWHAGVSTGKARTVLGWTRSLPDDQIAANPLAAHCAAWAAAHSDEPEALRRWIPAIEAGGHQGPLPDGMRSFTSSAALLRGVHGFDGLRVMRESARLAVQLETNPRSPWYGLAKAAYGFSLYLAGDLPAAEEQLEEAVRREAFTAPLSIRGLAALSLIAVRRGDLPRARDLASTARRLATRCQLDDMPQSSLAYTATGAVYAAQGRHEEALGEFKRAVPSHWRTPGLSPWAALEAMLALAQALLDLGDSARAAEVIDDAQDVLILYPDDVNALTIRLERLRRRLARPRCADLVDPLTDREVAVLRLLRGTLSRREIGAELGVSPNTVKTHTQAIYRKLEVSNRHDAVDRGSDTGLL
jgi:LuxR family transcriptional regulator, maltose regulon positive regulatory protein